MFGHFNFLEVINLEALIKRAGYRRSGRFKHTDGFRWKLPFSSKSDRRLSAYSRRSLSVGFAAKRSLLKLVIFIVQLRYQKSIKV